MSSLLELLSLWVLHGGVLESFLVCFGETRAQKTEGLLGDALNSKTV